MHLKSEDLMFFSVLHHCKLNIWILESILKVSLWGVEKFVGNFLHFVQF